MKYLITLFFALVFITGSSQIKEPVKWKSSTEKISDSEYLLVLEASIEKGWHVYSQFTPDGGPLPLVLKFKDIEGKVALIGKASESKTKKQFNDIFGVDEIYFEKNIKISQKVKLLSTNISKVSLEIDYQVCKDACINASKSFVFDFSASKSIENIKNEPIPLVDTVAVVEPKTTLDTIQVSDTEEVSKQTENLDDKVSSTSKNEPKDDKKGLLTIFFIAFFSGFAALLTPCVFPMIPMTVSFFTKQSKTKAQGIKNAIFYGLSIIIIYVLLGVIVTAVFGADALNALSTNVWFNIIFFALLVFFASSFLGAFEIMLPNSWANKVDRQADRGGVVGILFMALALAIVSFSCTGPIVGTLLVEAASKGGIAPIVGMLGFSLALALPFMLFAMFPGWLQTLPKSGGWLNTVKVFLGFLELALAFKFLSNADLVLQLHLLERELFLAIWIAIFGALTLYLLGKISLPHDSPIIHISVGRLLMALLTFMFTIYLIPGLWGAPLKLISAFPPPIEYSESPQGFGGSAIKVQKDLPHGAHLGPNQLVVFEDYDLGLEYAKKVNKPIMLDFTGRACVNCRKMENNVWSDPSILPILSNEVIVISLYVDEATPLPKEKQFVSKSTGATIETVGDKWTDFMISKYKTNTQPLYVLTDLQGNNLNTSIPTISYTPNILEYKQWLQNGISNFKK